MIDGLNNILFSLKWPLPLIFIALFNVVFAITAYKNRHLSLSGAIAAFILGTSVFRCVKAEGFILLFAFYASSYIISHIRKKAFPSQTEPEAKGSRRDWAQVASNGLCCFLASLFYFQTPSRLASVMFCASLAESTSDTWAGEIGRMSCDEPVSIVTGFPVKRGMSGGVTALGFAGSFLGCFFICIVWGVLTGFDWKVLSVSLVCGFAGCLADSVLGASVQAVYEDDEGCLTEHSTNKDGKPNKLVRGIRWIDNDMVNFMSNILSTVLAMGLVGFLIN